MKIGFTGTQKGMTHHQLIKLLDELCSYSNIELHHGDCIGADAQAHYQSKIKKERSVRGR